MYFMQLLPYALINESFKTIFKDLGVDNLRLLTWINLIALAWTFKLFWAPLVDINFSKRFWVLLMQGVCLSGFALLAFGISLPGFFGVSVALMCLMAIASATHDIACDGLYLLSLNRQQQAAFSGVCTASARLGRLFCTGALLWFAGWLQKNDYSKQTSYMIVLGMLGGLYSLGWLSNLINLPRHPQDQWRSPESPRENKLNLLRTATVVLLGACAYFIISNSIEFIGLGAFRWINRARETAVLPRWDMSGGDIRFALMQVIPALILTPFLILAVRRLMRGSEMSLAFLSYVRQSGFPAILFFIVFYRFGEAMVTNLGPLFLQDKPEVGGLNLAVGKVGEINGIAGVLGIIAGGIAGGVFIAGRGLRKAFWPLVICMHTPNLLYVWAAWARPSELWLYLVAFVDQFGYGFGFAGYFVYLMWVAQRGNFRTSHYAIGTGLGALFISLAGIFAGIVQATAQGLFPPQYSYIICFIVVCICTIPGMIALLLIPLDETEGRGIRVQSE